MQDTTSGNNTLNSPRHFTAVFQALFVTFLWSTSWVLIKIGIKANLPSITFAGLRYSLAFLCILPFVLLKRKDRIAIKNLSWKEWTQLIALGFIFYALTQGAQFLSLAILPAASVSLILNLSPAIVAISVFFEKNERPSNRQWTGVILSTIGVALYFLPFEVPHAQILGIISALVCLLANSFSSILGRRTNRGNIPPLVVTFVSMGIGAFILLLTGVTTQGIGQINMESWLIIIWLAVVNTALAFSLWNNSLRTLTAVESSILNGTMLPQIAILAWILLNEPLSLKKIVGMVLVVVGTLFVQLKRRKAC